MNETGPVKGTCLCGAVTLQTTAMDDEFAACHCGMCRRWGGGPFLAVGCGQDVEIDGKESVAIFNSSDWADRGFCKVCGTHLFYRLKDPRQYQIPVGLFGDSLPSNFGLQVFIDRKPEYYSFANDTKELTEAQIYEMYAPGS